MHPIATHTVVGGPYDGECYLILVGIHIMTRETPNWVWMTFWWSNQWWDDPHLSPNVQNKWGTSCSLQETRQLQSPMFLL